MSNLKENSFNIPNFLAIMRILIAPIMFWIIITPEFFTNRGIDITWSYYFAALLFVIASITDFFDGYIARMFNQITMLGKILDPLADKMLTIGAFLALMATKDASAWAVYIIIIRELFITGIRTVAVAEKVDVSASFTGKIKTVSQMVAIGFLIMHWPYGTALLWLCVALTLYSGGEYIFNFANKIGKR